MTQDQVRGGVLRWDPGRERLFIIEGDGASRPVRKPARDLAGDLNGQPLPDLDGVAVDFDWHSGQPRTIRRAGTPAPQRAPRRPTRSDPDAFRNPYAFVPAPPRDQVHADLADSGPAGPPGHHRIRPGLWTGRIAVTLTVETPLLLLDTSRWEPTGSPDHFTYPVLLRNGVPNLPPTSVKGMLRTAYEAVTNSRFGVFDDHADRLGYRMTAPDARRMVPARISDDGSGLTLLPGDTQPGGQLKTNPVLHAAWLPRYPSAVTYPDGSRPAHNDEVDAYVELFQHYRNDKGSLVEDFRFWRVRSLDRAGSASLREPAPTRPEARARHVPVAETPLKRIRGRVFVSNRNIGKKHDERVFFTDREPSTYPALPETLRSQWEQVIRNYRSAHANREIHRVREGQEVPPERYCGPDPGQTAWSPHQYDDRYLRLKPGDLCYALIENGKVAGLYPVMISRALHDFPARSLLPESLRPATTLAQLSPADRAFGWTNADGAGCYRGQLRIGPVTCDQGRAAVHDDPADFGEHGVPLAILGQPRPQQGRFYLAARQSSPQQGLRDGLRKRQWFSQGQGLRGRKFYLHHAGLADGYWDHPTQDRTQQIDDAHRYQEYRQPREGPAAGDLTAERNAFLIPDEAEEQRSDQNRSIRGWIRPLSTFRFTIEIQNLNDAELGALAWLLRLPPGHFHRLGYAKPLGFGSVRLDVDLDGTLLSRGEDWVSRYRTLGPAEDSPGPGSVNAILDDATAHFLTAASAGNNDKTSPLLDVFLAVAHGDASTPVHYPRIRPDNMNPDVPVPPDPRGRSFEWFQQNEKDKQGKIIEGRGRSLPGPEGEPLSVYPGKRACWPM